jgi:Lon protease-like protein
MNFPFSFENELSTFQGTAPLFPLPNTALYPNSLLPLHIFEHRYRTMVDDALDGPKLIALGLLQPGWEENYLEKGAPVESMVCLGHITAEQKLSDGRYYLMLNGISRARLLHEIDTDLPYRVANLELCADICSDQPTINREHRRQELLTAFRSLFPEVDLDTILIQAMDSEVPLGTMCDVLASSMSLEPVWAKQFLEDLDVDSRSDTMLAYLKQLSREKTPSNGLENFPPKFSLN